MSSQLMPERAWHVQGHAGSPRNHAWKQLDLLLLSRFSRVQSVRPHRPQPTRLPRPWDSPGKNTGVGCHFLLQCMKVKSESDIVFWWMSLNPLKRKDLLQTLDPDLHLMPLCLTVLEMHVPSSICAQAHWSILMLILARPQAESFVLFLRFG